MAMTASSSMGLGWSKIELVSHMVHGRCMQMRQRSSRIVGVPGIDQRGRVESWLRLDHGHDSQFIHGFGVVEVEVLAEVVSAELGLLGWGGSGRWLTRGQQVTVVQVGGGRTGVVAQGALAGKEQTILEY